MQVFAEDVAEQVFAQRLRRAESEVESLDEDFLAKAEDGTIATDLLSRVRLEPLRFRFDDKYISVHTAMIPAEDHPRDGFFAERGKSFERNVIRYHLPFDGDPLLLRCRPTTHLLWSTEIGVDNHEIYFDIVSWSNDSDEVKREAEGTFKDLARQLNHLTEQVARFNASIDLEIRNFLAARREKLKKDTNFVRELGLPIRPSEATARASVPTTRPSPGAASSEPRTQSQDSWDVFISHASEDKESFVRDLAEALDDKGLKVWYDEFTLTLGDSLRRSIDEGLAKSRFGIVVLSHSFFSKNWPQLELDGLVAKESTAGKTVLPIWHNISRDDVVKYSPILADRLAVSSGEGMENVVAKIVQAIEREAN